MYGEIHGRILRDLGYDPEIIFFFPPLKKPYHFIKKLSLLKGRHSWFYFARVIRKAWAKLSFLDEIELLSQKQRPRELTRGATSKAFERGLTYLQQAKTLKEITEAGQAALAELPGAC